MKLFLSIISTFLLLNIFIGCELKESKTLVENEALKQKELAKNAKIENDKSIMLIKKDIELAKFTNSLEKEKLIIEKQKKQNEYNLKLQEAKNEYEFKNNLLLLATFITILTFVSLYIFFNNRRKDKLKAYNDNLEKYFRQKENETKLQIANTISSKKLSKNIATDTDLDDDVVEIEVIEKKKKSKKKKKEKEKKYKKNKKREKL